MKNLKLIIKCGLVLLPLLSQAQTGKRIGIEMGFHEFFGNTIVPYWAQTSVSGFYGVEEKSRHAIHKMYAGIK